MSIERESASEITDLFKDKPAVDILSTMWADSSACIYVVYVRGGYGYDRSCHFYIRIKKRME